MTHSGKLADHLRDRMERRWLLVCLSLGEVVLAGERDMLGWSILPSCSWTEVEIPYAMKKARSMSRLCRKTGLRRLPEFFASHGGLPSASGVEAPLGLNGAIARGPGRPLAVTYPHLLEVGLSCTAVPSAKCLSGGSHVA
jgi:hypothetical protein